MANNDNDNLGYDVCIMLECGYGFQHYCVTREAAEEIYRQILPGGQIREVFIAHGRDIIDRKTE